MCGIVGLFLKDKALEPRLGDLLSDMLITMTDRGPDSAGIAIYGGVDGKKAKVTIQSSAPESDFSDLADDLAKVGRCRQATAFSSTQTLHTGRKNW